MSLNLRAVRRTETVPFKKHRKMSGWILTKISCYGITEWREQGNSYSCRRASGVPFLSSGKFFSCLDEVLIQFYRKDISHISIPLHIEAYCPLRVLAKTLKPVSSDGWQGTENELQINTGDNVRTSLENNSNPHPSRKEFSYVTFTA